LEKSTVFRNKRKEAADACDLGQAASRNALKRNSFLEPEAARIRASF